MKKIILSTLFIVFTIGCSNSYGFEGPTCEGNITLSSQAEVDAFDCTSVEGTLRISGDDIANLNSLVGLQSVWQLIIENNPNLNNLSGLSTLNSIGYIWWESSLVISNNAKLSNLEGLSSLTTIGGPLIISDNPMLRNIDGLSSVLQVSAIQISNNAELENIDGLSGITTENVRVTDNLKLNLCGGLTPLFQSIGVSDLISLFNYGNIKLSGNGAGCSLKNILPGFPYDQKCLGSTTLSSQAEVDGFDCPVVTGTLKISGTDITNLSGLSGLQKVGQLIIENNPNLTNLDGLSSLDTIQGSNETSVAYLFIRNNALLSNIDGLSSLTSMRAHFYTEIRIDNNPSLTNLNGLSSLSEFYWEKDGFIFITNNAALSDVSGLSSIRITRNHIPGSFHMDISHNPLLNLCNDLFPVLKSLGGGAFGKNTNVRIEENGAGCTLENILAYDPDELCWGKSLRTQEEVNDFFCRTLKGTLTISGDDIIDLEPLLILQKVGDRLVIENNPSLTNIYGLSSLDSIVGAPYEWPGELRVRNNPKLANIDGLSSLKAMARHLYGFIEITNNTSLQNIDGLSSLTRFDWGKIGSISITDNPVLVNIDGLGSLTSRGNPYTSDLSIHVINNRSLTFCSGLFPFFESLREEVFSELLDNGHIQVSENGAGCTVDDILSIPNTDRCTRNITLSSQADVDAFSCDNVEGILRISGDDIHNLQALTRLQRVGEGLIIENNPNLKNLDGLSSLVAIDGGRYEYSVLRIRNNGMLSNVNGLSSLSSLQGSRYAILEISNNSSLLNVDGLSELKADGNPLNNPLPYLIIKVTNNPSLAYCNGLFSFLASIGEEEISTFTDMGNILIADNGGGCTIEDIIASGPQSIFKFTVVNLNTGFGITHFIDSVTLGIGPSLNDISIDAITFPGKVGSVEFTLDKKFKWTDSTYPYRLPKYLLRILKEGAHTLKAQPYSASHKRGKKGLSQTAVVNLKNQAAIFEFEVVDNAGNILMRLKDGDVININDPAFKSFTIWAIALPATEGTSVKFWLNKRYHNTDKKYPFYLNGEENNLRVPWNPGVGSYTLKATPYISTWWGKSPGQSLEVRFTVVCHGPVSKNERIASSKPKSEIKESFGEEITMTLYPVPVKNVLYVKLHNYEMDVAVILKNIQGQLVYSHSHSVQELNDTGISTSGLPPGVYLLQIFYDKGFSKVLKFIKH